MTFQDILSTKIMSFDLADQPIIVSPEFRISIQHVTETGVYASVHVLNVNRQHFDILVQDNQVTLI